MALVGLQDYIAGTAFASASADIAAAVAGARSIRQAISAEYKDTFSTTSLAFVTFRSRRWLILHEFDGVVKDHLGLP